MIKMVFMFRKRPDLDEKEFLEYWRETHPQISGKLPGLRKYIQHHAVPGPDGSLPPCDGFSEMWWDDAESMESSLASPEGQAALADVENFLDTESQVVFSVEQTVIL